VDNGKAFYDREKESFEPQASVTAC